MPPRRCVMWIGRFLSAVLLLSLALVSLPGWAHSFAPSDPLVEVNSFAPATPPPVPERLRLVSYNLHGPPTERIEDIMEVLQDHEALKDAAIFALQEVNRNHQSSAYKNMARGLASALNMHYAYAVENPYQRGGGERGLAILSRFLMSDVERVVLPHPGPGGRRRITLGATIHLGPERLRVYTLHLETRISVDERGDQVAAVLEQANRYRELPTIILGDFNTITGGASQKVVELMKAAGFSTPLPGDTMTFQRALFLRLKLDWIWVRNLRVVDADIGRDITASDHRPIWADVEPPR
ncbi:MAG: endonuclease/exonuclease/phosphatase family protein [Acidobacteria bacterium]|nr:endonuclease/exonuclease/phosphatase family protein [Acidobacteriota bacterium]